MASSWVVWSEQGFLLVVAEKSQGVHVWNVRMCLSHQIQPKNLGRVWNLAEIYGILKMFAIGMLLSHNEMEKASFLST